MLSRLWTELANRRVLRTAGVYLGTTLLILRLAERLAPMFGAGDLFQQVLSLVLTMGFPVAVVLAWRYGQAVEVPVGDEGPGSGSVAVEDGDSETKIPLDRARLIDLALIGVVLAVGFLYAERFFSTAPRTDAAHLDLADIPAASIAVLPFQNFSDDQSFAYFAAGVHEDILTYLSRVPNLLVISRTSVMKYRQGNTTIPEIAKTLRVAHVLEGSVRRAAGRVRITVQLIRANDDAHLWAENFDRELSDVFAIQEEVAKTVTGILQTKLSNVLLADLSKLPTEDPQTYDWFSQARELIRLPSARSAHDGLALFEAAVERDPEFSDGYAGIALALKTLTSFDVAWEEVRERAVDNARRAIALAPRSPYAQYVMGVVLTGIGLDNRSAEAHLKRAIELDPNSGDAYLAYSENLYFQSRYEESFAQIREAVKRDPLSPKARLYQGRLLLMAGQQEQALGHISQAIDLDPDNAFNQVIAGVAYDSSNRLLTALRYYGQAHVLDPGNSQTDRQIAGVLTRLSILPPARAWLDESLRLTPADDEWFARKSQLLAAEGLYDALGPLAADWERYNPKSRRVTQVRASAASLAGLAARASHDHDQARQHSESALILLQEYLAAFRTPQGYRVQFSNIWSILALGFEERQLDRGTGDARFRSVIELYETQSSSVQLPNQWIHLTIAYAALGDKDKALENMRRSLDTGDYTYWVFRVYDLESDKAGTYHGITDDPEFRRLLSAMRADSTQNATRLSDRFPAILDPNHLDWSDRAAIERAANDAVYAAETR